jgi:transposase
VAAEQLAAKASTVRAFTRRHPLRKPFPDHLPRERVVVEAPDTCSCCGSDRIVKMGEDITETLEVIPRQWKVIQTVREKFTCLACEKISQPLGPFHAIPRGWAGPSLIAMLVFEKRAFVRHWSEDNGERQHQPLNRQAVRFAREGVELTLSTLAYLVGHTTVALQPIHVLIEDHVRAAGCLHGDDTTVPLLARGGAKKARLWTYVRDDRNAGQAEPAAAWFQYTPDRKGERPREHLKDFTGTLQADAYAGFHHLYQGGKIQEAACWAHVRRKFHDFAEANDSPIANEALLRIAAIYAIEQAVRGQPSDVRKAERQARAGPLLADLKAWLGEQQRKLSKKS